MPQGPGVLIKLDAVDLACQLLYGEKHDEILRLLYEECRLCMCVRT